MKWATPACPAASRREPARTYAAIETERAPGSRALITRGPAGSAVRSNIARMVQDGTAAGRPAGRPVPRADPRRRLGDPGALARRAAITALIQFWAK